MAGVGSTTSSVAAPAVNSGGSTTASQLKAELGYSTCMRSHGLRTFPDPRSQGGYSRTAVQAATQNVPRYQAAETACRSIAISAGFVHTPAQIQQHVRQLTAEDECIRKHGMPNMPDPSSQGFQTFPSGITPDSPVFQAAQKACAYLNP